MYKLTREVRFSVNPFHKETVTGFNSYASKPCGEGLCFYFALRAELAGQVDSETGFVVNVSEIDRAVRRFVVPIFTEHITEQFTDGKGVSLSRICKILKLAWGGLEDKFSSASLDRLGLQLNPFRNLTIDSEDCRMFYFSEKFEFAAMHKLWNEKFSEQRNFELFGKCANPAGHGHNYIVEVTVSRLAGEDFCIGDFEKVVDDEFISLVDHKNLNVDVEQFSQKNPTVENIAAFAWQRLFGKLAGAQLHCVTVWENDRTCCSYRG